MKNVASHSKELAEKVLAPELLQVLDLLSKFGMTNESDIKPELLVMFVNHSYLTEIPEMAKICECVKATLELAEKWKLIEKDESDDES